MGIRMMRASALYFVIGVVMGMVTSGSERFDLSPVHVHLNLLGWVALALGGMMYHQFPQAAASRLGRAHYWLHMIGIPVMMVGLAGPVLTKNDGFAAALAAGGLSVVLGAILFAINAFKHFKAGDVHR